MDKFFEASSPATYRVEETTVGTVTTTYVGEAAPWADETSAVWQIKKIVSDSSSGLTSVSYPGWSNHYKFAWSDRASLSYS